MENKQKRIEIELPNGYKLVAEQNIDPQFSNEIFVGVVDANGAWHQDLAIIRSSYVYEGEEPKFDGDTFDVLVYADKDDEDYTDAFHIGLFDEQK